jgi:hypothetical protein
MNYLAHFVFNHDISGIAVEPHFVTGVALPDLWLRFSRRRRIRWRVVRGAQPDGVLETLLHAGLTNHADIDRRFHALPMFNRWIGDVQRHVDRDGVHSSMLEFLAHVAIELALDHHLVRRDAALVDRFYAQIGRADHAAVERAMPSLVGVDASGLAELLRGFVRRQFIRSYITRQGLVEVIYIVLTLAAFPMPPVRTVQRLISNAIELAVPEQVWSALGSQD